MEARAKIREGGRRSLLREAGGGRRSVLCEAGWQVDVLIADTSGRLHTNTDLMRELEKVRNVFEKKMPGKPKEILLVVDATQGQNVLNQVRGIFCSSRYADQVVQARGFNKAVGVTGIVLTKLDGTSKGGVVVSIVDELKIPVKVRQELHGDAAQTDCASASVSFLQLIGVGEKAKVEHILGRACAYLLFNAGSHALRRSRICRSFISQLKQHSRWLHQLTR
eukprot:703876-Hanusia_phi.AAC.1